jgi:exodeoxyribonuclease VII small subunit
MTQKEVNGLKYDEALSKLQEISQKLENKQVSIDDLTEQVKIANMLTEHCKKKLESTEKEISKIIQTDNNDSVPPRVDETDVFDY